MPHISCNPDARCDTGKGERNPIWNPKRKLSRLRRLKRSTLEENKIQKPESFQPLRHVICQTLKRQTKARNQFTKSSARMFHCVSRPNPKKISRENKFDVHCVARKSRRTAECRSPFSQKPQMGGRRRP